MAKKGISCISPKCSQEGNIMEFDKTRSDFTTDFYICKACGARDRIKTKLGRWLDALKGGGMIAIFLKVLIGVGLFILAILGIKSF